MPLTVGPSMGGRDFRARFLIMAGLVTLAMLVLVTRLYVLQVNRGEEYEGKSTENFIKETRVPAFRGRILDRRGEVLVDNRPSYNVTLTPAFCNDPAKGPLLRDKARANPEKSYCLTEVIPKLATYLSLDSDEVNRIVEHLKKAKGLVRFREFTVKSDVDLDSLDRLQANLMDLPGVYYLPVPHRKYNYGTAAAHVLGYMNEITSDELKSYEEKADREGPGYQLGDYIGRRGVEAAFEDKLRGADGKTFTIVDAKGKPMQSQRRAGPASLPLEDPDELIKMAKQEPRPARPGNNLVLSLDWRLQQKAEEVFTAQAGAVAVVDVHTGFILAMLSKPAYDPNKLTGRISKSELKSIAEDPLEPLIFRAVQQHYHPGSTYKVVTALAGLDSGTIGPGSQVVCNGGYSLGSRRWRCHNEGGHGVADLHHAISWSCDTFFYSTGDRMGIDPIAAMARKLGFGALPKLGVSPEVPGIVPDTDYHNRVTPGGYTKGLALNTAIGQGDNNVSPMQLLMAYAAIANGGTLYKPQLVLRTEDVEGNIDKSFAPVAVRELGVKKAHLDAVIDGLKAVANEPGGTAYWIFRKLPNVTVAGKTGTAQVIALGGGPRLKEEQMDFFQRDHAWFVAFAPADKPEIAIVVLSEHGGHGGTVSGPPALEIIKEYFRLKELPAVIEPPPLPARPGGPPPGATPPQQGLPGTPSERMGVLESDWMRSGLAA